jgi:hypothetical protein
MQIRQVICCDEDATTAGCAPANTGTPKAAGRDWFSLYFCVLCDNLSG